MGPIIMIILIGSFFKLTEKLRRPDEFASGMEEKKVIEDAATLLNDDKLEMVAGGFTPSICRNCGGPLGSCDCPANQFRND